MGLGGDLKGEKRLDEVALREKKAAHWSLPRSQVSMGSVQSSLLSGDWKSSRSFSMPAEMTAF